MVIKKGSKKTSLSIELQGVQKLLQFLQGVYDGTLPAKSEMTAMLEANAFFIDFYSQWEGLSKEKIVEVILCFNQGQRFHSGSLQTQLAEGFCQAIDEKEIIETRIELVGNIDPMSIIEQVKAYLPPATPLDSVIHITLDSINNAFVHQGKIGVSLLKGVTDRPTFARLVAHELHHLGFRYWAGFDHVRLQLLQEQSSRSVAVHHVQNLLAEGLANYFCTPEMVFSEKSDASDSDPFQAKLGRLHQEETKLFTIAEEVLALCLAPRADCQECQKVFLALALDMEERLLPAAHYLGARMIKTINQFHSHQEIIECVQNLPNFLRIYNQAARKVGAYVFASALVDQFSQLWTIETTVKE